MSAGNDRPWKSSLPLVALLVMTSSLVACGDSGGGGKVDPAGNDSASAANDEAAERYREQVNRRVSASVVRSLSREWGVPEAKVECVLADVRVSQLKDASTDATVAAVFDKCGVDPEVVK